MTGDGVRIAAWSGPRNISTALMRSWGNRADTAVCDEPLYAHYLQRTGAAHPMAADVIEHHETDWGTVVATLTGPVPEGRTIFYQKHMAQHLLDGMDLEWVTQLRNFLLIRDPAEVLPSFDQRYPDPVATDTGLPQQLHLFSWLQDRLGAPPPVIDARDVLLDPPGMLLALCDALKVAFDPAMLTWEPGPRATDGIWAPAWYDRVEQSTGFAPYRRPTAPVPERLRDVVDQCRPMYARLHAARLQPLRS